MTYPANESDRPAVNFELSHDAVAPIHGQFAALAKAYGQPTPYNDQYPVTPGERPPLAYVMPVNGQVVKELFQADDDMMVALEVSELTYAEPHRMYPAEADADFTVYESVALVLRWQLAGSQIGLNEYYWLTKHDGIVTATITPEYYEIGGQRIGPNDLTQSHETSDEPILDMLVDVNQLDRPLMLDDTEKLYQLIDILNG